VDLSVRWGTKPNRTGGPRTLPLPPHLLALQSQCWVESNPNHVFHQHDCTMSAARSLIALSSDLKTKQNTGA
jgi:hypothetical protein